MLSGTVYWSVLCQNENPTNAFSLQSGRVFGDGLSLKIYFGKTHPQVPTENCTVSNSKAQSLFFAQRLVVYINLKP